MAFSLICSYTFKSSLSKKCESLTFQTLNRHLRDNNRTMFCVTSENDKALKQCITPGKNLSQKGKATRKGKNVVVFPADDICVVFNEVTQTGLTTAAKPKTGPKPPPPHKIKQLYSIKTTAKHSPPIEIRIILPQAPVIHARAKLWRWYPKTKEWKDITKSFSRKYHLIIGQTNDRLESMFGVT
jgi:hypothetical protein